MGCFSSLCNECKEPVNSTSFEGELVRIFLLKDGKVIDEMTGPYDSYGAVFGEDGKSIEWKMPWREVCQLEFNGNDNDGQAFIHVNCFKEIPTVQSERDPSQGWGRMKKKHLTPNPK